MTEWEIIYSLLETIRDNEINDDDKMSVDYLRHILYSYRADSIKNDHEMSEEMFQEYKLIFEKDNQLFVAKNLPDIIYDKSRYGISILDMYGTELPVVSKEEAVNSQKSKMYVPPYIAYIQNQRIYVKINQESLNTKPTEMQNLYTILNGPTKELSISCILAKPKDGVGYDWKKTPFPFYTNKLNTIKQNILRREFGIMLEVKKDDIQNTRADNIIYQDESKLYK